ncbi:hypothetical protein ACSBR1_043888 [Camellia fascicularis]
MSPPMSNGNISSKYKTDNLDQRLVNVKSFPHGIRNCYILRPEQGKNNNYLIRAWFLYGNYDRKNSVPNFDLYIGANLWDSIWWLNASQYLIKEIMYMTLTNYIHVCLVNIGAGTPFISALELRHLDYSIYKSQSGCMLLYERKALGAYGANGELIGYKDELGRLWTTYSILDSQIMTTIFPTDSQNSNDYKLPREMISTAVKPLNVTQPLACYFDHGGGPTIKLYVYFHFCELRNSGIMSYLKTTTITQEKPESGDELWITIVRTNRSTLPPILNAMEIYVEKQLQQSPTDPEDVDAMVNISSTYGVKKNWQGDPCFPMNLSWNLSSSGLTGVIAPALSSLKSVLHLDLSNNSLTRPVPEFLAQLPALKILNLANNNLTGSVPKALLKKSSLILSMDGNPNLCWSVSCKLTMTKKNQQNKKKNQLTVAIVASVYNSYLVGLKDIKYLKTSIKFIFVAGRTLKSKNRRFSHSEVVSITNNFETVIGRGGFGTVHLGYLEDGTEAELLTTIHHRNLAPLIGYCDEGSNTALIYEYMANGNLQECLLDKNRAVLTWEQRLHIAIDASHDFGLTRIFPDEDGDHVSTAVVGTLGYLDPEYYSTSRLTEKSDVYSFGVVLLELITGQPAIIKNDENIHVVNWVKPMLERGEISNIVDPRLQGEFDINSAWKALETAMACVPTSSNQRLTMSRVVGELKESLKIYLGNGKTLDTTEINKLTSGQRNLESSMICPQAR